ncbi:MAG: T9SS type A sorting domain-containing protein [Chitinispirillaceae bacterium]
MAAYGSTLAQTSDTFFIPITNGNNWMYAYQKNVRDFQMIRPDTAKNGTFQMSMNSVVVQNDSIYFTLSTIDSGLVTIDSAHVIKSFPYRNNHVNDYALIDSVLYRKDSLGVWRKFNTWYLSYCMLSDTAFPPGGLACLDPSSYYSRNTSTSTVIFGTQGHMLDSTHILSENLLTNVVPPSYDLYSSEWTSEWIKDIGCSYYVNSYKWIRGFINGGVCESGAEMTDNTESWTLISSNGSTSTNPSPKAAPLNATLQIQARNSQLIIFLPSSMLGKAVDLAVYTVSGRQVVRKTVQHNAERLTISVSGLALGTYLLTVKDGIQMRTMRFVAVR